jgi:hypothetical protein
MIPVGTWVAVAIRKEKTTRRISHGCVPERALGAHDHLCCDIYRTFANHWMAQVQGRPETYPAPAYQGNRILLQPPKR